eukprot:1596085-Rhodomonas_salina.4
MEAFILFLDAAVSAHNGDNHAICAVIAATYGEDAAIFGGNTAVSGGKTSVSSIELAALLDQPYRSKSIARNRLFQHAVLYYKCSFLCLNSACYCNNGSDDLPQPPRPEHALRRSALAGKLLRPLSA